MDHVPKVGVGPFNVVDLGVSQLQTLILQRRNRRFIAFALHVGGLNSYRDREFIDAMSEADIVYADGHAIVLLARVGGATAIERAATTDIGLRLINAESTRLGRTARIAIVGGSETRVTSAATTLANLSGGDVIFATHGYHTDYSAVLEQIRDASPDIVIIGLGMPQEAKWIKQNASELPKCLIFTCGGWLGFLAGEEPRAPVWMQNYGLEWLHRLLRDPRRLFRRYSYGAFNTLRFIPLQASRRMK